MALALNNLKKVDMPFNKETKPNQSAVWNIIVFDIETVCLWWTELFEIELFICIKNGLHIKSPMTVDMPSNKTKVNPMSIAHINTDIWPPSYRVGFSLFLISAKTQFNRSWVDSLIRRRPLKRGVCFTVQIAKYRFLVHEYII